VITISARAPRLHENTTFHHRAEGVGKTCARAARTSTSLIAAQFALPHGRCSFAPERANAHVEVDLRTIAGRRQRSEIGALLNFM
jgi:hypothetical protein